MFTGIIQELGKVEKIARDKEKTAFTIQSKKILANKKIGDSIAVNGVCITIIKKNKNNFTFEAISETMSRTNFDHLKLHDTVNLESAMKQNQSFDGHFVQGHIDTCGSVKSFTKNRLTIIFPPEIEKYLAFKGSIAINGVSLTISDLQENTFSVDLIPHTLKTTNLGLLKPGSNVNIEIDIIARYLESLLNNRDKQATYQFLKERNLI